MRSVRTKNASSDNWTERAKQKFGEAADADSIDEAIVAAQEGLLALYLSVGENPGMLTFDTADYAEFVRDESNEAPCTCPPDLVERGGWQSTCPVHGSAR